MILNRMGKKTKIAGDIMKFFPAHTLYIEPFFGAGGMFFAKQKAKYNIVNDIDKDVYNLFRVIIDNREEFEYWFNIMPIHQEFFNMWRSGERERNPVLNAVRFIVLSNFSLKGKADTLKLESSNTKIILLKHLNQTIEILKDVKFSNLDFREFLNAVRFRNDREKNNAFIYADPPYQSTNNNYSNSFAKQDLIDLFEILINKKVKFAVSEFDNPAVLDLAKSYDLNVNYVCERHTIASRNTEILITNYKQNQLFEN